MHLPKHTLHVFFFFLAFLVLSVRGFREEYFPYIAFATLMVFLAYAVRFKWQELIPTSFVVLFILFLKVFVFAPPDIESVGSEVVWLKEVREGRLVAVLEDGRWIKVEEGVEIGDTVDKETGKLLLKANPLLSLFPKLRFSLYKKIGESIDYPISSLVSACTLGVRWELPHSLKALFSLSGLYHFLAISGLHVGIAVGAISLLFKLFRLKRPILYACLVLLPLMPLTGLPPSAVRAYLFALLIAIGVESYRKVDPLYLLGFLLLLSSLLWEVNLSAVLSFLAVGGILLAATHSTGRLESFLKVSLAPFLLTLPVILYIFGTVNYLSWLSTLAVGIIFTPFLALSFLSEITLFKLSLVLKGVELLGELFVRSGWKSFELTKGAIVHAELPIETVSLALIASLALVLVGKTRLFLTPLALLLLFALFNQNKTVGEELSLRGKVLNSARFLSSEGQKYEECTIRSTYVMPYARKFLFKNRLIDERLELWEERGG